MRANSLIAGPGFYADWRVRCGAVPLLKDDADSPPESLLQAVWQHQRLLRDQLQMVDGEPVRILHPGFRSLEGGPDFRQAIIQIGDEAPRSGDVEVDLRSSGWRAHGHDRNPAFKTVILHVVWDNERATQAAGPRRLALRSVLDAPLGELSLWLGSEAAQGLPAELRGRCCAPLKELSAARLANLLDQAAHVRLESKAAQFQARARQAGWEQALWEGLFRALGYKHNVWPMQRLAELRPRWAGVDNKTIGQQDHRTAGQVTTDDGPGERGQEENTKHQTPTTKETSNSKLQTSGSPLDTRTTPHALDASRHAGGGGTSDTEYEIFATQQVLSVQARLFGISGLLPAELTRAQSGADGYVRAVWDHWWRERDEFADCLLPRSLWRFHALRPANHPQRRLALASLWCATGGLAGKLEAWCAREIPESALASSLLEALQVGIDDFWSWHYTFRSARLKKSQPLLGTTRVTDMAVNVVLPWLWSRAGRGKGRQLKAEIERRYMVWPAAEDNALLRLARQRLLGGASRRVLPRAAAQQGLIQIVRDFCEHSNSLCDNCRLPDMVQEFRGETANLE